MIGENFQIYGVQISEKCIRQSHIYYTPGKTLPQVYTINPQKREITRAPQSSLLR